MQSGAKTGPWSKAAKFPTWSYHSAPSSELFVDITADNEHGAPFVIANQFPLSLLLLYSKRAKRELPPLGHGTTKLIWKLPSSSHGIELHRGLSTILQWIHNKLRGKGYAQTYNGQPQLIGGDILAVDTGKLVYALLAMEIFELAPPPNHQRVIPNMLAGLIQSQGINLRDLVLVYELVNTPYKFLVDNALEYAINFFDTKNLDRNLTQEQLSEFNQVLLANPAISQEVEGFKREKEKRNARDQLKQEHEGYLERVARREAEAAKRKADFQDRQKRSVELISKARNL